MKPNRLYSGAPPVIPHAVRELGRGDCLDCHRDGYVTDLGRIAGRTPHPELERCVQCHVEQQTTDLFVANTFVGGVYRKGQRQQPMGPWLIPHPLTLRENCLACHHGLGVPQAQRTDHPERVRCLQCHLPANEGWPQARPQRRGI